MEKVCKPAPRVRRLASFGRIMGEAQGRRGMHHDLDVFQRCHADISAAADGGCSSAAATKGRWRRKNPKPSARRSLPAFFRTELVCAANLKFLSMLRQVRDRNFKFKAALEIKKLPELH
jgi:hypothetical protein